MSTELTVRIPADLLGPISFISIRSTPLFTALYDRLVALGPDGEVVPYLATSWTVAPEGIDFRIRPGVTASDGSPVTPSVIKTSLDFALDPATTSRLPAFAGAGPFTVEADDDAGTLSVRTGTPNNELLGVFAGVNAVIMPPDAVRDGVRLDPAFVGSGPYVLTEVVPGESVHLRRRTEWTWGPPGADPARLPERITFRPVAGDDAVEALMLAGDLHVARVGEVPESLAGDASVRHYTTPSTIVHQVICNVGREPFRSNLALRRALFSALDRHAVMVASMGGSAAPSNSIFSPEADCYADLAHLIPEPSADRARQLLGEAGYTERGGHWEDADGEPLAIELLASAIQGGGPDLVRRTLTDLGVTVREHRVEPADYNEHYIHGRFDMTLLGGEGSTRAPTNMARFICGPTFEHGGTNYVRMEDPELEELARAARSASADERCALWKRFQEHYLTQAYGLPTGASVARYVTRGCEVTPIGDVFETWSIRVDPPA